MSVLRLERLCKQLLRLPQRHLQLTFRHDRYVLGMLRRRQRQLIRRRRHHQCYFLQEMTHHHHQQLQVGLMYLIQRRFQTYLHRNFP